MAALIETPFKDFGVHLRAADAMLDAKFMLATKQVLTRMIPPSPEEHTGVIAERLQQYSRWNWPSGGGLCVLMGAESAKMCQQWRAATARVDQGQTHRDTPAGRVAIDRVIPGTLEVDGSALSILFERSDVIFFRIT